MSKKSRLSYLNPLTLLMGRSRPPKSPHDTGGGRVRKPPKTKRTGSYLPDETKKMDRHQRELEQEGHRRHFKRSVHAREHNLEDVHAPEGELQNDIKQHPWLEAQRFDGIDPNVNPVPALNTTARTEYDNAVREQQLEMQLRLGLAPKMSTAPKPQTP